MMSDALVYLAAAVVCVPLARVLGLGSVLGYLIAGIAIGPWGLGMVEDVESILHFSEFGVVLMLFVIGLELDTKRLLAMRAAVFGGGALQLALSGGVLAAAGMALGLSWQAALVGGLSLALSSTAIAVQTMNERNLTPTPTGRSAFAILLFQDIAAIPLLAAIPFLAGEHAHGAAVGQDALKAAAAIGGVLIIGRYLTRPALRLVARANIREVFTAFALLLVIGISQLMNLAGVSMALGAFLAGVLLASSEYKHALETDIEPFKGLLLGLFFISVGMTMNFGLIRQSALVIAALLVGILVLKLITLYVVSRIMGVASRERWLFAALLAQGGEFAFVVFTAAQTSGVLSERWAALLTMAVALSMAATPLLLALNDKITARSAARSQRKDDTIDEDADTPIIIAGFGRFGQIVGRLLFANGLRAIVLDHDPEQIDTLRKFGYRVYYGDATRLDLLRAAGAERAKLLVNAIDDVGDSIALTDRVRENFPNLTMVARARNVTHYVELRTRGVIVVERETFESALRTGRHVLETMGIDPFRAKEMADAFRRLNLANLDALLPHFKDEVRVLSDAKAGREELREFFTRDRKQFETEHKAGWNRD